MSHLANEKQGSYVLAVRPAAPPPTQTLRPSSPDGGAREVCRTEDFMIANPEDEIEGSNPDVVSRRVADEIRELLRAPTQSPALWSRVARLARELENHALRLADRAESARKSNRFADGERRGS